MNALDANALAIDPRTVGALRHAAKDNSPESMRVVAKQFESMFMNILLKSMRATATTGSDGLFDNEQTKLYTEMLDQQIAQKIATSGKGLGIADMLMAQMQRNQAASTELSGPIPLHPQPKSFELKAEDRLPATSISTAPAKSTSNAKDFVNRLWPHAASAGRELGVPPQALLAQAALESGWGKREITMADGSPSHNLFGIKAGSSWQGKTTDITTTEYVNGAPRSTVARFRAYDSYEDAFKDYIGLLQNSPRYAAALQATDGSEFAAALQRAGYATDPAYATKLTRIMASETMRQALLA